LIFKTRRKLLSTLILQKPTPTTIFNPVKKKRQFFRVGNTLTFAASPLFHPLSISSPSPLDTHKKQPLLSFLSLLSTKKSFVLSPDIEDRDEVDATNWAKHKKNLLFLPTRVDVRDSDQ
jgi:hypothetical protein